MSKSEQEREDQRVNSGMEDSNMTIEFLRARLLSERTVSKCARERADELSYRVAELEEQLRIVSFQRMKAEKATADVLAILGDYGVSDVPETDDSNSDQDIAFESRRRSKPANEEEQPVNSRVQHESEFSGSEFEFTPSLGRSLSWKGRKDNTHSTERYKDPFYRRRNSIPSVCLSPRHRTGKSCRQVRRKESRYMPEDPKTNAMRADPPAKETSNAVKVRSIDDGDETAGVFEVRAGRILSEAPISGGSMGNEANASSSDLDNNMQGIDVAMEQAIKNRAQLIGQYEAMERAQSEWEEKFRENNYSNPDSCDPGNRSDVTEERYEMKEEVPLTPVTTGTHINRPSAEANASSNFHQNGVSHSSVYPGELNARKSSDTPAAEPIKEGFAFPREKAKENRETSRTDHNLRSDNGYYSPDSPNVLDFPASESAPTIPPRIRASLSKEAVRVDESYALVPRKGSEELGSVLEALKQAKQSLQQKIKDVPLEEVGALVPSLPSTFRDTVSYPVGPIGLFRLPTDFAVEDNIQAHIPGSAKRLSLGGHYPDTAFSSSFNGRLVGNSYLETRSTSTYTDHLLPRQYQGQPTTSTQKPYLDPSSYRRIHSTGRHISSEDQRINAPSSYFDARAARGIPPSGGYLQPQSEFPSGRFPEFSKGFASGRPPSDPYTDTGMLTSTRFTYPSHPMNASYQNPVYLTSSGEAFSSSLPSRGLGVPPADNLPFSNGSTSNMYRY